MATPTTTKARIFRRGPPIVRTETKRSTAEDEERRITGFGPALMAARGRTPRSRRSRCGKGIVLHAHRLPVARSVARPLRQVQSGEERLMRTTVFVKSVVLACVVVVAGVMATTAG